MISIAQLLLFLLIRGKGAYFGQSFLPLLSMAGNYCRSAILASHREAYVEMFIGQHVSQAVWPFDNGQALAVDVFDKPEILDLFFGREAVEIHVVHGQLTRVFVHQAEGRAGDVAFPGDFQAGADELADGGFAGSEITVKEDNVTGFGNFSEGSAEAFRLG